MFELRIRIREIVSRHVSARARVCVCTYTLLFRARLVALIAGPGFSFFLDAEARDRARVARSITMRRRIRALRPIHR